VNDADLLSLLYDIRANADQQDMGAILDRIEPIIGELEGGRQIGEAAGADNVDV